MLKENERTNLRNQQQVIQGLFTFNGNNQENELHTVEDSESSLKKPPRYIPPIRRKDNYWATTDREKAEVFVNHLEEIFQPSNLESNIDPLIELDGGPMVKLITSKKVS